MRKVVVNEKNYDGIYPELAEKLNANIPEVPPRTIAPLTLAGDAAIAISDEQRKRLYGSFTLNMAQSILPRGNVSPTPAPTTNGLTR